MTSFYMTIKIPTIDLDSDVRLFAPKASNVPDETMNEMYFHASFVLPKTFAPKATKESTKMSFVHTNFFASLASPDTGGYCDYCRLGCESCCDDDCTGCSYCCNDGDCVGCSWCDDYDEDYEDYEDYMCDGDCGRRERECDCEFDDERPWRSTAHIRRYGWY